MSATSKGAADEVTGQTIKQVPLAGAPFGKTYKPTEVEPGEQSVRADVPEGTEPTPRPQPANIAVTG